MNASKLFLMVLLLIFIVVLLALFGGCARVDETPPPDAIQAEPVDYVVSVIVDMSGSFQKQMATDGAAWEFLMTLIDLYFRQRLGEGNDRLVISVIAAQRTLVWEGRPVQLREQFQGASDFGRFLERKAQGAGSNCCQGLADAVQYLLDYPGVVEGRTRTAVFCLSDMEEFSRDGPQQKARLQQFLPRPARCKSVIGLYYVSDDLFGWRQTMRDAGFKNWAVESDIVAKPTLPRFAVD